VQSGWCSSTVLNSKWQQRMPGCERYRGVPLAAAADYHTMTAIIGD
jgi:hypothetical protein